MIGYSNLFIFLLHALTIVIMYITEHATCALSEVWSITIYYKSSYNSFYCCLTLQPYFLRNYCYLLWCHCFLYSCFYYSHLRYFVRSCTNLFCSFCQLTCLSKSKRYAQMKYLYSMTGFASSAIDNSYCNYNSTTHVHDVITKLTITILYLHCFLIDC